MIGRRLILVALLAVGGCSFVPDHRVFLQLDAAIDAAPDALDPSFVAIPSGEAIEGDRVGADLNNPGDQLSVDGLPVHRVYTSGFTISKRCVSRTEYQDCVAAGACTAEGATFTKDQAAAYCAFRGMRLPTEAELERATRGDNGDVLAAAATSPFGLEACTESAQWVSDGYRCDAYVGRAWANPMEASGPELFRSFLPTIGPRQVTPADANRGFRCAKTVDTGPPPAAPAIPPCTGNCAIVSIALGDKFGCALRGNNTLWCWGSNADGELGTGNTSPDLLVDAIPASTAHAAIFGLPFRQVVANHRSVCGLSASGGDVRCWGSDRYGELGDGMTTSSRVGKLLLSGMRAISGAGHHTCAVDNATSDVKCWGSGGYTATTVTGPTTPTLVATGASFVASGPDADCIARSTDVQCWGMIYDAGGTFGFVAPASPRTFSITASRIALGSHHVCAIVGVDVQCFGDRTAWGGTGIATTFEVVASSLTNPQLYAAQKATVIISNGAPVLRVGTDLPATIDFAVGFDGNDPAGGCADTGSGTVCVGHEAGQLGTSNGCDSTLQTTTLTLP